MDRFPVDAPRDRVVRALECLGFEVVREGSWAGVAIVAVLTVDTQSWLYTVWVGPYALLSYGWAGGIAAGVALAFRRRFAIARRMRKKHDHPQPGRRWQGVSVAVTGVGLLLLLIGLSAASLRMQTAGWLALWFGSLLRLIHWVRFHWRWPGRSS